MIRQILVLSCTLVCAAGARAIDFAGLQAIGDVTRVTKSDTGVVLSCADRSEVQLTVLAPDLVRVRVAFQAGLPARDHSWAIAKTAWAPTAWTEVEDATSVRLTTAELEVVVQRSPLLVEFRDARTHRVINADRRPMAFDGQTGTVAAAKRLGLDEHFYGLGEKAARLDKRRGEFSMWNSDTPGYREGTDPIYQSIPFYLGWEGGAAYGLFFDNSFRTRFDFGAGSPDYAAFAAEGGEMNYYFFAGPALKKILGRYAELTGHMPLPPLWALGHQQSRYSYTPDSVAEEIVRRYRAEDLPLDVLHLDIHYMNEYRDFTWNPERYPHPKALTDKLRALGVKVVTIVDPGIKYQPAAPGSHDVTVQPELAPQDDSYYAYNQGLAQNFFLKRKSGGLYIGKVWPGQAVFVDYTIDAAARWWGDLHRAYTDQGVAGIWDDMNEPSDFIDKSGKSQTDVISYDGGANSPYAQNRNVFALGMTRATYEGLQRLRPNERPFVITRAGYAGVQRYSSVWTGDNTSTWEALALTIPMFETLGLSGEPFVGGDIPGFMGRADGELLARWYEVGFLVPFCRNHCDSHGYDHEPWRFGTYYEDIVRKYLKLRYKLLPFLYTTMEEAHRDGMPAFRPLVLNFQADANTLDVDDEFMVGNELLAAPIVKPGLTERLVYLPAGRWYDYWTGAARAGGTMVKAEAPLETVPLYVRGGSIIPSGAAMNYVGEKPSEVVRFDVYPDETGNATGSIYEDDNTSPAYEQGVFRRTAVSATRTGSGVLIEVKAPEGSYQPAPRGFELTLHGDVKPGEVLLDDKPLPSTAAAEQSSGWFKTGDAVTVRLRDDGHPHRLLVK